MTGPCNRAAGLFIPGIRHKVAAAARISLMLTIAAAGSGPVWASSATTWKWLDDQGRTTYGDKPPSGVNAQRVRVHGGGVSSATPAGNAAAPVGADPASPDADAAQTTAVASAGSFTPENAAQLCAQARTNLEVLSSSALIRQTDETGNEHILDDQQKATQIQRANDIIKHHCR